MKVFSAVTGKWREAEGYAEIPHSKQEEDVEETTSLLHQHSLSLTKEEEEDKIVKTSSRIRYWTLVASFVLFGVMGLMTLNRMRTNAMTDPQLSSSSHSHLPSFYRPCHTSCSDSCSTYKVKCQQM